MNLLARLLNIQSADWNKILPLWSLYFVLLFGNIMGVNATNSLFISLYKVDALPFMYLVTSLVVIFISLGYGRFADRHPRSMVVSGILGTFAAVILVMYWAILGPGKTSPRWFYPAIYVITQTIWLLGNTLFWTVANDICHTREAKRLFPIFAAGGLLGCIASGFFVSLAVKFIGTANLYLVWAVSQGFAIFLFLKISRRFAGELKVRFESTTEQTDPTGSTGWTELIDYIRRTRFMKAFALATVLLWITVTATDFAYFKITAAWARQLRGTADPDLLTALYGWVRGVSSLIALVMQLFLTNRIFSTMGVGPSLLIFPILTMAAFGVMAFSFSFLPGIIARGARIIVLTSIQDPLANLLFSPVPQHLRGRAKAFMDGVLLPAGTALAGILIIFSGSVGDSLSGNKMLCGSILAISFAWFLLSRFLKGEYLNLLISNLKDTNYNTRLMALEALGKSRERLALEPLVEALRDESPQIRISACAALGRTRDPGAIEPLIGALSDPDVFVRSAGAAALGEIGDMRATMPLLEVFQREDHNRVKATIISVLGVLGGNNITETLKENLESDDPRIRANSIEAIGAIGGEEVLRILTPCMRDSNNRARANAAVAVFRTGDPSAVYQAVDTLSAMSFHPNKWMRASAASAYGMIGENHFAGHLLRLMGDPDTDVRRNAVKAIANIHDESVVPALIEALSKEIDAALAGHMVSSIVSHGPRAVEHLRGRISSEDPVLKGNIAACLGKIGGEEAMVCLEELLEDSDEEVRVKTLQALENFEDPMVAGKMALLASDPSHKVRATAIKALGRTGSKEVAGILSAKLTDPDPRVRSNALDALINLDAVDFLGRAKDLVHDTEPRVRAAAAVALHRIGDPGWSEPLKGMVNSQDKWTRISAIYAMGCIGEPGFSDLLIDFLGDPDPDIRRTTISSLEKVGGSAVERLVGTLTGNSPVTQQASDGSTEPEEGTVDKLLSALMDKDDDIRVKTAEILGRLKDPKAIGGLMKALADENRMVREKAARSLGMLSDHRALPVLAEALTDPDDLVQENALASLAILDPGGCAPRIREYVLARIEETSQTLETMKSLRGVEGSSSGDRLVDALRRRNERNIELILKALGIICDRAITEVIRPQLFSANRRAFSNAMEAMENLVDKDLSKTLIPLLEKVREARAVAAQREVRRDDTLETLLTLSRSDDENLRSIALRAFGEIGITRFLRPLIDMAATKDDAIKGNASEILSEISTLLGSKSHGEGVAGRGTTVSEDEEKEEPS